MERSGHKRGNRKSKGGRGLSRRVLEESASKRDEEEKERLRKWEECWEKKLQAQEEYDNAECCRGKGLCLKPRTQSNIWINVTRDRSLQEIQMTFKNVPVPRPKPPPLPPLPRQKAPDIVYKERRIAQKVDKMTGTTRRKKK